MWISPAHPDKARLLAAQDRAPTAPEPSGRELARFDRPGFGRKPDAQLRVALDEFASHPFVSVRLFQRGADGQYWPTKTGTSIRISEVEDFAEAILEAARLAHATPARLPSAGAARRRSAPRATSAPSRERQSAPPAPTPLLGPDTSRAGDYSADFDEFDA